MSLITEEWCFEDDYLYKYTPVPELGKNISHKEMIMSKELFIECYKRWILGKESSDDSN